MRVFIEYKKGDTIGNSGITFIDYTEMTSSNKRANFRCICGKEFNYVVSDIKNSRKKSCGCVDNKEKGKLERYLKGDILGIGYEFIKNVDLSYPRKALFRCVCGKEFIKKIGDIKRGRGFNCGCDFNLNKRNGKIISMHGMTKTVEYNTYNRIKERCYNTNSIKYKDYGGRGIFMSEEWRNSFLLFLEDMGPRPSKKHSIERIDNNKGYCKENCKWATQKEQSNNRRCSVKITFNGQSLSKPQWSEITGLSIGCIVYRMSLGWSVEDILTKPRRR